MRDIEELKYLASHLEEIKQKTTGISLGGALRSNSTHLNFAIRKLEFVKTSKECLCRLYLLDDLYDPERERKAGNIRITGVVRIEGKWVDYYECECALCDQRFRVEEREYQNSHEKIIYPVVDQYFADLADSTKQPAAHFGNAHR